MTLALAVAVAVTVAAVALALAVALACALAFALALALALTLASAHPSHPLPTPHPTHTHIVVVVELQRRVVSSQGIVRVRPHARGRRGTSRGRGVLKASRSRSHALGGPCRRRGPSGHLRRREHGEGVGHLRRETHIYRQEGVRGREREREIYREREIGQGILFRTITFIPPTVLGRTHTSAG